MSTPPTPAPQPWLLLNAFQALFQGQQYLHRRPNQGDRVAQYLYDDLLNLARSSNYVTRVHPPPSRVVNGGNQVTGILARRGDGTFGELVPMQQSTQEPGYAVRRGPLATLEIGAEVKIIGTAALKQIDRVISDLANQRSAFHTRGANSIKVAIVGVNHAPVYTSYEGDRVYTTNGTSARPHPVQAANDIINRLQQAAPLYEEFLILRFAATNANPFAFSWVNVTTAIQEYASALVRISNLYDSRFP